jgi:integrase
MKLKEDHHLLPDGTTLRLPQPIIVKGTLTWNVTWRGKRRWCFGNAQKRESHKKYIQFRSEYIAEKEKACTLASPVGGGDAIPDAFNTSCDIPSNYTLPAYQVGDMVEAFLDWAKPISSPESYTHDRLCAKWVLKSGYGNCPVNEFSPKKLKDVRQRMIKGGTLCRKQINAYKNRIIRMFAWAVEEEMLDKPEVVMALKCVKNLRRGEQGTRDNPETESVPEDVVRRTLPFLVAIVAVMVQLQWLLGLRPRNVFMMRVGEIDRSREQETGLWYYKPGSYKTERYIGKVTFPLGRAEQALIAPYLKGKKADAAVFSYREYIAEKKALKREGRTSKVPPSQAARDKRNKGRKYPEFFDRVTYRNTIQYGIKAANAAGVDVPHWTPYRLRNSAATVIALEHGIEAAQAQMVHRSVAQTRGYSDDQTVRREQLALKRVNPFL